MVKEVVGQVVESLKSSPVILAVILLNAIMVSGSVWFLTALASAQQARFNTLLQACIGKLS
jgi:hypothetical protein